LQFFDEVFKALSANLAIGLLTIAILAIAWLIRDGRTRDKEHNDQVAALYQAQAQALAAANAAHLQTAMQVTPLASKLVTCIEVLERLSDARLRGAGGT
jgi:hypothetical protein